MADLGECCTPSEQFGGEPLSAGPTPRGSGNTMASSVPRSLSNPIKHPNLFSFCPWGH